MVKRLTLAMTKEQRDELLAHRDHDPRPQMRERCAAILRVADGEGGYAVARQGVLKPRKPDTVYAWVHAYERGGVAEVAAHLHGGSDRGRLRSRHAGGRPGATAPSP